MQFSPTSCHFNSVRSKYSPQHSVLYAIYTYIARETCTLVKGGIICKTEPFLTAKHTTFGSHACRWPSLLWRHEIYGTSQYITLLPVDISTFPNMPQYCLLYSPFSELCPPRVHTSFLRDIFTPFSIFLLKLFSLLLSRESVVF
jgi:hypothetical protein